MDANVNVRRRLVIQGFAAETAPLSLQVPPVASPALCIATSCSCCGQIQHWRDAGNQRGPPGSGKRATRFPVSWATTPLVSWHFLTLDLIPLIFLYKQQGKSWESCGKQKGEIGHTRNSETSAKLLFKVINSVTSDHKADLQFASRG